MRYIYLFLTVCMFSSCYAVRAYKFRKLKLTDHEKMPFVNIEKSSNPYQYKTATTNNYSRLTNWLDSNLSNTHTAAFLVVKNDTVIYEKYFRPYTAQTLLPSYSVIKSFVSTLISIAHAEGKIRSLQDPVTMYIPELQRNDPRFAEIKIQDLLDMRSGIKWNEGVYSLKDDAIKMGFRPNIMKQLKKLKIENAPSNGLEYKSINTLLLGIVLERATKYRLEKYFEEKLWQPLGASNQATLNTDKKGQPITYAGLNATARDFSLLGSMFLHNGYLNGHQIVSPDWVKISTHGDSMDLYSGYKNQWWAVREIRRFNDSADAWQFAQRQIAKSSISSSINDTGKKQYRVKLHSNRYMAKGILGQYIFVNPDKNLVIVRLGQNWRHPKYYVENLLAEVSNAF